MKNKSMQELTKKQIVEKTSKYFESTGITQKAFAAQHGIHQTYISYMMQGKWNQVPAGKNKTIAIDPKYFIKVASAIGMALEEEPVWGHFETINYQLIINTLEDARAGQIRRAIDGETGYGKTYAIRKNKRENPVCTYVVTCADDLSAKGFMLELAEEVGIKAAGMSRPEIRKAVVRKLSNDTNPLLLIDEAENLKDGSYGAIKSMCDALEGRCGIVLIGANGYKKFLEKKADAGRGCFPQIYRRFKNGFTTLEGWVREDVEQVCNHLGITNRAVINFLFDRTRNMGDLETALTIIQRTSQKLKEPITLNLCLGALDS